MLGWSRGASGLAMAAAVSLMLWNPLRPARAQAPPVGTPADTTNASGSRRCGDAETPWVAVVFAWKPDFRRFETTVMADLRAGFSGRDIDVCREAVGPEQAPLAVVTLSTPNDDPSVSVEIQDTVTRKRVGRDVDLSAVPQDGRAFAIALATDELVWASWAELALERRTREPQQKKPAPPQVKRAIEQELPSPPKPRAPRLALRGAADVYTGGQQHVGLEGALAQPLTHNLLLDFSVGLRQGLAVETDNGRIQSQAAALTAGARTLLVSSDHLEWGLAAFASGAWVQLRGEANAEAAASELTRAAIFAGARTTLELRLAGPLWFSSWLFGGAPIRSVEALDDGAVVTGVSGLQLGAQLGLAVEL